MVFCEVVAAFSRARGPVVLELILLVAIAEPQKTHVHGFCVARQDVVGHDAQDGAIVGFDWGGGLFVCVCLWPPVTNGLL